MLKHIINDTVNDIALYQTSFGFHVRYGLEVSERYHDIRDALRAFKYKLDHAIACQGFHDDDEDEGVYQ